MLKYLPSKELLPKSIACFSTNLQFQFSLKKGQSQENNGDISNREVNNRLLRKVNGASLPFT